MKELLIRRLHSYLLEHHMDLLISLQEDHRLKQYLDRKVSTVKEYWEQLELENRPGFVIEALCMEELTCDLRPSRFEFVRNLLEEDFEQNYQRMLQLGILSYEVINLIGACEPIFLIYDPGDLPQNHNELKVAISEMIAEYLDGNTSIKAA